MLVWACFQVLGCRREALLAHAERPFRAMKSPDVGIRPVHHRLDHRVPAHIFLCMLAYAIRFELETRLARSFFKDDATPGRGIRVRNSLSNAIADSRLINAILAAADDPPLLRRQ